MHNVLFGCCVLRMLIQSAYQDILPVASSTINDMVEKTAVQPVAVDPKQLGPI